MIKHNLKPTEKFIKFINPTDTIGKLMLTISVYDEPVMLTSDVSIFSVIKIEEEMEHGYRLFGEYMFDTIFTDKQIGEQFNAIQADPEKYHNK